MNGQNNAKNRKSEAQEQFEQADNAGRFAGNDADAQSARSQAMENVRQDTGSSREERDGSTSRDAHGRPEAKGEDYNEEAQNVSDDNVGNVDTLNEEESKKARNKANEGLKQGRNGS